MSFLNTAVIVSCTLMAMVFLLLPLPENKGLHKYRISLRFLAGAYITMALLKSVILLFHLAIVNLIPIEGLVIAALQAPLFAFTLITLINPRSIKRNYLYRQLMPVFIFIILFLLSAYKWGNPSILTFAGLRANALHPTVIIRELFLFYYAFQLFNLTRIFTRHTRIYQKRIDNYFADSSQRRLVGVKRSFYSALVTGIFAFISCFIPSPLLMIFFEASYALFYLVFALFYIQYPGKFTHIEPVISVPGPSVESPATSKKRLVWDDLKKQIIENKYYLKSGVTIDEMAQYLKIGRTTLSTFINNNEGMNFNLWVNSLRIEDAKNLLIDCPHYSLTQIAELIGYSEPSNFSRQFKLITKESPSIWRQTCQTESDNYKLN